ncbi:MAG TPA: hypothetical protein VH643_37760 [Gemmataceae bacterium]|jgi:hypothetical protein
MSALTERQDASLPPEATLNRRLKLCRGGITIKSIENILAG